MDKYVNLVHIPGHSGIIGNDLADEKAREGAQYSRSAKMEASDDITVADEILAKNGKKTVLEDLLTVLSQKLVLKLSFQRQGKLKFHIAEFCFMIPCSTMMLSELVLLTHV